MQIDMQTWLCSLLIILAGLYLGNRWLPFGIKQRLMQFVGKNSAPKPQGACGSCSSCGSCSNPVTKSIKLTTRVNK